MAGEEVGGWTTVVSRREVRALRRQKERKDTLNLARNAAAFTRSQAETLERALNINCLASTLRSRRVQDAMKSGWIFSDVISADTTICCSADHGIQRIVIPNKWGDLLILCRPKTSDYDWSAGVPDY